MQVEVSQHHLAQGVSTQPQTIRLPGQVEGAINVLLTMPEGATKRPGTWFVTKLVSPEPPAGLPWRLHPARLSDSVQHLYAHVFNTTSGDYVIRAIQPDGTEDTVTITLDAQAYLDTNSPGVGEVVPVSAKQETYWINKTVPVDVLPTPSYTVTDNWDDVAMMRRHTPADDTYHYATAEDTYWRYDVDAKTFGTATFEEQSGSRARPDGEWDRAGTHAARIQFGRFDLAATTGIAFTRATNTLTKTGAFAGYTFRQGDKIGITSGTGLSGVSYAVDVWFDVVSKTSDDAIVIADNAPTGRLPGTDQSDWAASYIGPRYIASYTSSGVALPSMQDVAQELTDSLNGNGDYDALVEWEQLSGSTGRFIITTPTRGADSRVVDALSGSDTNIGESLISGDGVDLATSAGERAFGTIDSSVEGTGSVTVGTDDTLAIADRWTQVPEPGAEDGSIDPNTMPVRMTRANDGSFTVDVVDWSDRVLGDDTTNPSPELFTQATARGAITNISIANPTVITSAGHGLTTGDVIDVRYSDSVPTINGVRTVTVTGTDTFTVPVNVTTGGSAGNWSRDGKTINHGTFYQERLVFVGGNYVVASQAGVDENFYLQDPLNIVNDDPIVAPVSSSGLVEIGYILPNRQKLVLLTRGGQQFELTTSGALTPSSITIDQSTSYRTTDIEPIVMSSWVYFMAEAEGESQLFEYAYSDRFVTSVADNVLEHAAGFVPTGVTRIASDSNTEAIVALVGGGNDFYVYKSYWSGDQKLQSAWSKWDYDEGYDIHDVAMLDGSLYMLVESSSEYILERQPLRPELAPTGYSFAVHLDRKLELTGTDSGTDTVFDVSPIDANGSTFNAFVTSDDFSGDADLLILEDGAVTDLASAGLLPPNAINGGTWTYSSSDVTVPDAPARWQDGPVMLGRWFDFQITPTPPFVEDRGSPNFGRRFHQASVQVQSEKGDYNIILDVNGASVTRTYTSNVTNFDRRFVNERLIPLNWDKSSMRIVSADARPLEISGIRYWGDYVEGSR